MDSLIGILNIDKPAGMTSHDVVGRIRRIAHLKRVGHAGTLDPDATGVLLVCIGSATRFADYLAAAGKEYQAVLVLGTTTTTEDASGTVLSETDTSHVTQEDLQEVLPQFIGGILQTPPMVSAVHHQGKRLYELARAGVTVERTPRPVQIDQITLHNFHPGPRATASMDVVCGKGTYIRTLCADIGAALGVGGHMQSLRRTHVGGFGIQSSVLLDDLTETNWQTHLVSPVHALPNWPCQTIETTQAEDIRHGRAIPTALADTETAFVLDAQGQILALARAEAGTLHPHKVFTER